MLNENFILLTDSYKNGHDEQYPPGTTHIESYFEARDGAKYPYVVPAGLQYQLKRYFIKPITKYDVDQGEDYFMKHMGCFNRAKWMHIVNRHGGLLPLSICSVPEGLVIPPNNVITVVKNTDPACRWLTNYAETLLVQDWYPTTVATQSRIMKGYLLDALVQSGDPGLVLFKLHDFGCRGVSCMEEAAIGGFAHLINFLGTDTVPALQLCHEYYHEDMAGFSINASEHSTITSWLEEHEVDAMRNMIKLYGNQTLYACVSDSYDLERAVKQYWGGELKDLVLGANGTLVVRPDSGDPREIVPKVLNWLWDAFGGTVNVKGYRVLNPKVRVIQGDGIQEPTLRPILSAVMAAGFSSDNLAFGSGGGLLRMVHRDTLRMAFKCCEATVNEEVRPVQKRPATDLTKASKAGALELYRNGTTYTTAAPGRTDLGEPVLREVFRDGRLLIDDTLAEIRKRAA